MADRYEIEPHRQFGVIYGLHAGDGVIRYVGQTTRLRARMTEHIIHSRDAERHVSITAELAEWIRSIEVLHVCILGESVPVEDLEWQERCWIKHFGLEHLLNRETSARRVARAPRTTKRGHMRFSFEQVADIRRRAARGETRVSIAREFDVHRDTIEKIVNGRTYPE